MSVYIIAQISITDRESYDKYDAGFMEAFEPFGGEILSVDEDPLTLEGEWTATRSVLLKFESKDIALAWLNSDAYKAIVGHRHAGSTMNGILVNAFEMPES
ncbi:MAG: DUF1330 domain-containing protein [Henriciella sp.]|jgi:uncharacterized protein (DUF1330 family)